MTLINSAMQRGFDSNYALALYENCLRYKDVGSTGWWEIDKFRRIMGATAPMYDEFKYLKRDVINKPVLQVNKVGDIHIEAELKRELRKVIAIKFAVTESQQSTLLKPEAFDQYADIRENETFKKLIKHGIGEYLALKMVVEDEARTTAIIDYVEKEHSQHRVKRTTGGYIRKLVESGVDVRPSAYEQERHQEGLEKRQVALTEAQVQAQKDAYELKRKKFIKERRDALSKEQFQALIDEYRAGEGSAKTKSYRGSLEGDLPGFKEPIERIAFNLWISNKLVPKIGSKGFSATLENSPSDVLIKENVT
jgi:Initiator Replication protein